MKITFNPSTVAALTTPPNNKDITFDLRGRNIFARGVKFYGTDTNTWRDIKINNVSIGSHTLDLRNGSNTTLTNTNGVVTINSTWRPVVDNLTSDSTTSSLSAKQGKVLKVLIDGKSNSDHNHDGRYLRLSGQDTMQGNLYLHSHGTSYIGKGLGDKSGADFTEANIVIRSWWGISFKSFDDKVRTYIDTRTGNIGTKGVLNAVGAVIQGRVYNGGDDEGIIINPASNGCAGLILGTHNGERSVFYLKKGNPFWRYNNGSTNLDIQHPKKPGVIALTSDIPSKDSWNYDDRYLRLTGGWMSGDINFGGDNKILWGRNTDSASISFKNDGDGDTNSYMSFVTSDNGNEYFRWSNRSGSTNTEWMALRSDGLRVGGTKVSLEGHTHDDRYYTKAESNAKYITDITTSVNKLTFTRNGSNIIRDITVNVVHSQGRLTNIPNKDATTKASPGLLIYDSYAQTIGTNSCSSVLSINTGGTIQIAGNWGDDHARNLYWRSQSDKNVADYPWKSWRTILDSENYSSTLDSRYYTESEVNSLLDAKLNRQNLSYGNWNPRGCNLAADYHYNGGDLSISEYKGKMYISVNGCFWQNEGQYRVLDISDVGYIQNNVTLHQYLLATNAAWYPLVWGGASHNNTSDSTGPIYKSYDKLCWQTSSQTLYATNIQTNNIKNLSIGGGIYWNSNVESATDGSDAASITLVKSGVAGGTTLVLSQMNDTNDTIQFKTNTAARLYHNSYPILTTQNTYVSNNKGYINGLEITQVNNADTLDGYHENSFLRYRGVTNIDQEATFWSQIGIKEYYGALPDGLTNTYDWGSVISLPGTHSRFEIYASHKSSSGNGLYYRSGWDSDKKTWLKFIDSSTIGSQTVANAYHLRINSANTWSTWYWAGQSSQPSWLWGSNDGTNMYVWNPSNFNVNTAQYLRSLGNQNCQTGRTQAYGDVYSYNTYDGNTGSPTTYCSVIGFGRGTAGTVEIAGGWCNTHLYWRSLRDCCEDWFPWRTVLDSSNYTEFINNYYWANVKISASSSTTTSPTVSNLTATSSIRMSNISLEHTDEINNSANGGIYLNYRNSGNVSLCYGGGNVGIGTNTPTQKLDVIGNIRASGQLYLPTNGNYNAILMGDDCWMGDCNINNVIGLSGTNNANSGGIKFGKGGMYIGYNGSNHYSSGTSLWTNFNADTVDGEHASNFSYTHQSSFDFSKGKSGRIVTFDQSGTDYGWINGFASTHNNYLTSVIFNVHRSSNWYVGYMEANWPAEETRGLQAVHKLAFADGDANYPIFLGYLNLFNGADGTISSSFPCLGYSVPFTYTRGGSYCLINIPNTSFQTFYIKAALASVHYSGSGMGNWVGTNRGDGAWWLHCDAVGSNTVQVKGFHPANGHNDSWWGGNPLYSGNGAAKIITVCLFGYVKFK